MINKLIASGISVTNYQLYYYKILFKPVLMVAMGILACCFTKLGVRKDTTITTIGISAIIGIVVYFVFEIAIKIMAYNGIAAIISVLLPICLILFIANFLVLHLQED
jgi:lipopolysaccharide export system permease protein